MKIGILGAPGSGKTNLAQGLKKVFREDFKSLTVVDEYVENLEEVTGNAYGHFATYVANLQVTFERFTLEQDATRSGGSSITCGTVIDSMIYAAIYSELAREHAPNPRAEFARISTTMSTFGMLVSDTFDYDLAFYLPYSDEYRLEHQGEWDTTLDLQYGPTLVGIEPVPILLRGDDDAKLAKAVQNVFEYINTKPVDASAVE